MADFAELAHLVDLPLELEATLEGPALRVEDVLALEVGSLIPTRSAAGDNIDVYAGGAFIGSGELGVSHGRTVVRMVRFKNKS